MEQFGDKRVVNLVVGVAITVFVRSCQARSPVVALSTGAAGYHYNHITVANLVNPTLTIL